MKLHYVINIPGKLLLLLLWIRQLSSHPVTFSTWELGRSWKAVSYYHPHWIQLLQWSIATTWHWCLCCQYLFGIYSVKVISTEKWCLEWRNHKVWKTNYHLFDITWSSWLGGGVWGGVRGLGGRYTWGFWRSECKWVKIPQRKRSQNLHGQPNYGWPSKFFFSYLENGPGGIFWPKRDTGRHLEHPEKVPFLTERGRKRVKEWRDATFMKE